MLHLFLGSDRDRARAAMEKAATALAKKTHRSMVRITDANRTEDLLAVLQGRGLFNPAQVVMLDGVCLSADMRAMLVEALAELAASDEAHFVYEEKPDAVTKRLLEKHAETVEKFDPARRADDKTIFALATALKRRDKKNLWIGYLREVGKGTAPEAIHGTLFWAAKSMLFDAPRDEAAHSRAKVLVAALAELPHDARRAGFDLEYALERFTLSGT